jgi:putative tricarboxylic transport membrane protein
MIETAIGMLSIFSIDNMLFLIGGCLMGFIFGIIPGLQNVTAICILLPFTFAMTQEHAFITMCAIYCTGCFAGAVTAILYGIPGAPENAATVFDGFTMAKKGEAAKAIGASIVCSAIGGLFSALVMIFASHKLAVIALAFGPPEYFSIIFFALSMVAMMGHSVIKSIISVLLGLLFATVGLGPISGQVRFTFGSEFFLSGFDFVAIMVGVFAISEVLDRASALGMGKKVIAIEEKVKAKLLSIRELWHYKWMIIRCSLLGTWIGIMPAMGAVVAAFMSYDMEKKLSPYPERWGTGIVDGVIAPETGNNASTGGAMIPLLTLGIPGSGSTAVMLGVFLLHGLQPGEALFRDQSYLVNMIYSSMILSNIVIIFGGVLAAPLLARLANLSFAYVGPAIVVFCSIGAYTVRNNMLDVWSMFAFGVLGYLMDRHGFSIAVFVLGFILGPLMETSFLRSMIMFDNSVVPFLVNPFCAITIGLGIFAILWAIYKKARPYLRKID